MKNKIILISGPTASGKSNFAYKVAKKINGEIINADSIQIYKDLKILTARPNIKDSDPVHHLYGFLILKLQVVLFFYLLLLLPYILVTLF